LGIGNTIRGDDSIAIQVVRKLREFLPPKLEIKELSTSSLGLMDAVIGYDKVILIDTICTQNEKAGRVYHLDLEDTKPLLNLSSTHAIGFNQVIELGKEIMGKGFPQIEVLAIEAKKIDEFSEELSPELEKQFEKIVQTVKRKICKIIYG
jgi:hydrogenase maturation protease